MRYFIPLLLVLIFPVPAIAQFYAHPLFVEAARDPGRAENPVSPFALAVGGQMAAGTPEAAMFAPSTLLTVGGTEISVWGGSSRYQRSEFVLTPALLSSGTETRAADPSSARAFGAVVADRGPDWALALFADSSAFVHEFATENNRLTQMFAHGSASWTEGTGRATVSSRVTRFGGSLAFLPVRYFAIGVSGYAVRLRHDVGVDLELSSCAFGAGQPTRCFPAEDSETVSFADTKLGMTFSATIGNERFSATGRWRREPRFEGDRAGVAVALDLPDVKAINARAAFRLTAISAEVAHEEGAGTFARDPDAPDYCGAARIPDCLGWGFGEFELEDALSYRVGIEQKIATRLVLRGGAAVEPSRIARIIEPGDRALDDSARVYRISGGLAWRTSARNSFEAGVARDRYGLTFAAGYRIGLQ